MFKRRKGSLKVNKDGIEVDGETISFTAADAVAAALGTWVAIELFEALKEKSPEIRAFAEAKWQSIASGVKKRLSSGDNPDEQA